MNPVLFTIGSLEIRWYSLFILLAVVFVFIFSEVEAKRFNIGKDYMFNMLFWAFVFGVIGARLYYVLFNWHLFKDNPIEILYIWNGGLAIHGGIIGGFLTILVYCKKYNANLMRICDIVTVPLLLGQAIGRWGNFFNQEAHGAATTIDTLEKLMVPKFVIAGMEIDNIFYFPTFYFESIICFFAFVILLFVRRGKYIKVGTMTASYLLTYGLLRFFIEASRTDSLMLAGFKVAQVVSIIMIVFAIVLFMYISRKGKFESLYNDSHEKEKIRF